MSFSWSQTDSLLTLACGSGLFKSCIWQLHVRAWKTSFCEGFLWWSSVLMHRNWSCYLCSRGRFFVDSFKTKKNKFKMFCEYVNCVIGKNETLKIKMKGKRKEMAISRVFVNIYVTISHLLLNKFNTSWCYLYEVDIMMINHYSLNK